MISGLGFQIEKTKAQGEGSPAPFALVAEFLIYICNLKSAIIAVFHAAHSTSLLRTPVSSKVPARLPR